MRSSGTASDFHSGIISYTVAVSGWPTHEWQPWLISTTQTSALYHAPRADDVFDFRVTAYDRAGNSAQDEARTRVDRAARLPAAQPDALAVAALARDGQL